MKLFRWIKKPKRISPLNQEIVGLKRNIASTEDWQANVANQFWANGGICCPCCGVPGYSEASSLNERRMLRLKQLEAKLLRDRSKREAVQADRSVDG